MFDNNISTSVDRLLLAPESKSMILDDEKIFDEIREEARHDTFQDFEFLELVRSELHELPETEEGDEVISNLPYTPVRYKILHSMLRLLGWKFFLHSDIEARFEDLELADKRETREATQRTAPLGVQTDEEEERILEEFLEVESEEESQFFMLAKRYFLVDFVARIRKLFLKSKFRVGLDCGTEGIKYVQIRDEKGKNILDRYQYMPIEHKPDESASMRRTAMLTAIQKIVPYDLLAISDVNVALSGLNYTVKTETIPKLEKKELDEAVQFKALSKLPEEIKVPSVLYEIVDTVTVKEASQYLVRMYVFDDRELSEWTDTLQNFGISPAKISFPHQSLIQLVKQYYSRQTHEGVIVFDFGGTKSQLLFIHQGILRYIRNFDFGVDNFLNVLTGTIKVKDESVDIDRKKAERMLKSYGIPSAKSVGNTEYGIPLSRIGMIYYPVADKLVTEIKRSIGYFKSNNPDSQFESMILMGGGSETINLNDLLESQLGIPVQRFSYIDRISIGREVADIDKMLKESYLLSQAVGLALDTSNELNMLPESLQGGKSKNLALLTIGVLTLIVVLLIMRFTFNQMEHLDETYNVLSEVRQELELKESGLFETQQLRNRYNMLEEINQYINAEMQSESSYDRTDNILKILSEVQYPDIVINKILVSERINDQAIDRISRPDFPMERKITLLCESTVPDKESAILNFVLYLKELPYFNQVEFRKHREPTGFSPDKFEITMYIRSMRVL